VALWHPDARRMPEPDNGSFTGGPGKGLLHSTETPFGDVWATYQPGTKPHLEVIGKTASKSVAIRQFYPLSQPARALGDGPLAVRTNRDGVVQIECGFKAAHAEDVPDWYWRGLAHVLRWVENQTRINAARWATFKPFPASFGVSNGVRFTAQEWDRFDGWCGHMHVPDDNTHGDPGLVPVSLLRRPTEDDMTPNEMWQEISSHEEWFVDKARVAVQAELGDENAGEFSNRIVQKVAKALPTVPPPDAIDYDLLAKKVADELARRMAM
jgi:hypothetical protein